jgi:hypothetical protein
VRPTIRASPPRRCAGRASRQPPGKDECKP